MRSRVLAVLTTILIGVYYTGSQWGIFNEGFASIMNGQTFNVFVIKRHYLNLPLVRS